jgi:hypothetical protein
MYRRRVMDYVKPQGVVEHMLAMGGRTGTRPSRHREGKTVECLHIQITGDDTKRVAV